MSFETLLPALAEYLAKKAADRILASGSARPAPSLATRLEQALSAHMTRVASWSASDRILRMSVPKSISENTVALAFASTPRRFRSQTGAGNVLGEHELIASTASCVILGPPGAGKTTTLKRTAQTMLTAPAEDSLDTYQTPLLIRLRDLDEGARDNPLLLALATELGLYTEAPPTIPASNEFTKRTEKEEWQLRVPICEGEKIDVFLWRMLNELRAVLLLDGLDEVTSSARRSVELDIEALLHGATQFKVLVTCRTGEYRSPLGYAHAVEICGLTEADVSALAGRWLGERHGDFIARLRNPAIAELSSRPLFLTHLLAIFDEDGSLPEQPYEIYEQVVMLMLREWDRERRIQRRSQYSDFGPKKKLRLLAAIAYELTYENRIKVFSTRDLVHIYDAVHHLFGLPADEAEAVAAELESHTGIIAEAGNNKYEFSHLTIQEYLCAEHLVTSPFPTRSVHRFLEAHPAPLAIATALSADPAGWLAGVVLHDSFLNAPEGPLDSSNLEAFLNRLELENPVLVRGDAVGLCVLALCFRAGGTQSDRARERLLSYLDTLVKSVPARVAFVRIVRENYKLIIGDHWRQPLIAKRQDLRRTLPRATDPSSHFEMHLPVEGRLPREWMEKRFASELAGLVGPAA